MVVPQGISSSTTNLIGCRLWCERCLFGQVFFFPEPHLTPPHLFHPTEYLHSQTDEHTDRQTKSRYWPCTFCYNCRTLRSHKHDSHIVRSPARQFTTAYRLVSDYNSGPIVHLDPKHPQFSAASSLDTGFSGSASSAAADAEHESSCLSQEAM